MRLRFRRSIRLLPGFRVNLGLRGASLSFGGRGLTYNVGAKGSRVTVGLPSTGVSVSQYFPHQNSPLISNTRPTPRRFSLTPLVVIAFLVALVYSAIQSTDSSQIPPRSNGQPTGSDVVGSIDVGGAAP